MKLLKILIKKISLEYSTVQLDKFHPDRYLSPKKTKNNQIFTKMKNEGEETDLGWLRRGG